MRGARAATTGLMDLTECNISSAFSRTAEAPIHRPD
jgi:hypothetical protein